MDDALKTIRSSAVGLELDEEKLNAIPVDREYEYEIPTAHGSCKVWLTYPAGSTEKMPLIFNLHGGGYVKALRGQDRIYARILAENTHAVVMNVDYKTSPEYRYPVALDETCDVIRYTLANAEQFGIDPKRVIYSGQSSGGTLLLAAAFKQKASGEALPLAMILSYPPVDMVTDPADKPDMGEGPERNEVARKYNAWYADLEQRREIYASPLYATTEDLKGLPPVTLLMAEKDQLRREQTQLAVNMIGAGVTVTARMAEGAKHGFVVRRHDGCAVADPIIYQAIRNALEKA